MHCNATMIPVKPPSPYPSPGTGSTGRRFARALRGGRAGLALALLGWLGGCAHLGEPAAPMPAEASEPACETRFAAADRAVTAAGRRDSASWPVPGHPYLRSDRLLAALAPRITATAARDAWLEALAALDAEARRVEYAALPTAVVAGLPGLAALDACRVRLVDALRTQPAALATLQTASQVPDEYRGWQRVLGGYPLLAPFVRRGVTRLHERHPVAHEIAAPTGHAYAPGDGDATTLPDWQALPRDALGRLRLAPAQVSALLRHHAPAWHVRVAGPADRIGTPGFGHAGPQIDTARPVMYTYISHTLFDATVLLQLNYVIWFPARPADGAFDLLAGDFDGLTWRVTLDTDGAPLVHDVMHNCGCYHQWFPGPRLRRRPPAPDDGEALWLPWGDRPLAAGPGLTVHLAAGTHYLEAVTAGRAAPATRLALADYRDLYRLPHPDGTTRPLFDQDGLLRASARGERFVLWPLGVPSPGAMRGRGHHAVAFVGRRHFDEAALIGRYFVRSHAGD